MLVGFYIGSRPSGILHQKNAQFNDQNFNRIFLTRVGTANITFNVFNTGRLLLKVAKNNNQLHCKCDVALAKDHTHATWLDQNHAKASDSQRLEAEMQQTGLSSARVNSCLPRPPQKPRACATTS